MIDVPTDSPPTSGGGLSVVTPSDVASLRKLVGEVLGRVEIGDVFIGEASDMWSEFDRIGRLADAAKVLLASKVHESGVWRTAGDRDAATYMARISGSSVGAARRSLSTSTRLTSLLETRQAMVRGELSVAQAEAIADAAAKNPGAESRLLGLAGRMSLLELRQECLRAKAAGDPDPETTHRRIHAERHLRTRTDAEGAWCLQARGTAEDGALINLALEPIITDMVNQARDDDSGEPIRRDALAFDALVELGRRDLADDDLADESAAQAGECGDPDDDLVDDPAAREEDSAGDIGDDGCVSDDIPAGARSWGPTAGPGDGRDPREDLGDDDPLAAPRGREPATGPAECDCGGQTVHLNRTQRRRRGRKHRKFRGASTPNYTALIRADLSALVRGYPIDGELCEISGTGPVPVSVARELLGESILHLVVTRGRDANVTYLGRGPNAAQRLALLWRNPVCAVEGCPCTLVDSDHRREWRITRHTRLDELDLLCDFHHDLKTRVGWALVDGQGKRPMVAPDDPRHPSHRRNTTVATPASRAARDQGAL